MPPIAVEFDRSEGLIHLTSVAFYDFVEASANGTVFLFSNIHADKPIEEM